MIDIGTGESWTQLHQHPSTLRISENVPSYVGIPSYFRQHRHPPGLQPKALDGVEMHHYGRKAMPTLRKIWF